MSTKSTPEQRFDRLLTSLKTHKDEKPDKTNFGLHKPTWDEHLTGILFTIAVLGTSIAVFGLKGSLVIFALIAIWSLRG